MKFFLDNFHWIALTILILLVTGAIIVPFMVAIAKELWLWALS